MTIMNFDDINLLPNYSEVNSRNDVSLKTNLSKVFLEHPIIPANMSTICGYEMAKYMLDTGGVGFIHRGNSIQERCKIVTDLKIAKPKYAVNPSYDQYQYRIAVSVGCKTPEQALNETKQIVDAGSKHVVIDIAHGHSLRVVRAIQLIKEWNPNIVVTAGNVADYTGFKALWVAGADVIKVGVSGGCLGPNTRVLMSNGFYKNINEIKAGERIITMTGKPATVKRSFSTGVKNTIKIRTGQSFQETIITPDHNCFIGDLNSTSKKTISAKGYAKLLREQSKTVPKQSKFKWKAVGDMKKDVFLLPKSIQFEMEDSFEIDMHRYAISALGDRYIDHITPSYDLGYIFGTFLGDGTAKVVYTDKTTVGGVSWSFGINETDIAENLVKCVKRVFGVEMEIKPLKNILLVSLHSIPHARMFLDFEKRQDKSLPEEYWCSNNDYQQGLLDGLIDSDGCVQPNGTSFYNTSVKLSELYFVLIFILRGYYPNVGHVEPTTGGLKNCNIENCCTSICVRQNTTNKRTVDDYYVVKELDRNTDSVSMEVFDLEIDDDTHSFIADNIIVHNSVCGTNRVTGFGCPTLTSLMLIQEGMRLNDDRRCQRAIHWNTFPRNVPSIIADGGIRSSGDMIKCMVLGKAQAVCIGGLLAGTDLTPGPLTDNIGRLLDNEQITWHTWRDEQMYKSYHGMSSHKARREDFNDDRDTIASEGQETLVQYKGEGSTIRVMNELLGGLRSGLSYLGVHSLTDPYTVNYIER